ncbi:MAG: DNA-directed RNA polymerase subunit alpha C-terminal domain-containing protein [Bacilli bacterium]|nr:hypothetical protein [Bacilli bacterium]
MNKSIRILKLPIGLIEQVEAQGIYHIHELINSFNTLKLSDKDNEDLNKSLSEYKMMQLHNEISGYKEIDKYEFINSLYSLKDLKLSLRSMNALNNSNIFTISKLLLIIEQMEIYDVENLGSKSIVQVMESVLRIVEKENLEEKIPIYSANNVIDDVVIYKMNFTQGAIISLEKLGLTKLGDIRKAYLTGALSNMFNYKTLNVVIKKIKKYYNLKPDPDFYFFKRFLIDKNLGYIRFKDLKDYIKSQKLDTTINGFLEKIKNRKDLIIENDLIRLPYFLEKVEEVGLKEESEAILLDRFSGYTLQSVADRFKKTRERIRQIVRDRMVSITMFYEEAFVKEFNKFNWHPEVFKKMFNLNELSYNVIKYLGIKYSFEEDYIFNEEYILELMRNKEIGKFDIEEFKMSLPEIFPARIEVYGKLLDKMTKREFLEYVIEYFIPHSGLHKNRIIEIANKVAADNKIDYFFDKYIDIVTNTIQSLQKVRFYDYSQVDDNLLNKLKEILYSVDSVYSCTYFYIKHKKFLNKYDLRDGYELHFILRRYFSKDLEFEDIIDFNRQPMIAKKGMTFSDVVIQNWKDLQGNVNIDDFANSLIKKYGYHKGTLINVINATLGDYISLRTVYHFEAKLTDDVKSRIKNIMKDDFYELQELADILEENGITQDMYQYFSNSWLKDLGYKTHDINYIIKEEYTSLKNVFFDRVLSHDVYQMTEKDHKMRETTLILFIENLRSEYLAFPAKGNKLVTMNYLESKGIKKADIVKYVEALKKYLNKEEYFTYYSLKKNNYQETNPIFKKMENYKLDNELMVSFIRNVPGIKKTTKGNLYRISKNQTTISEFLNHITSVTKITDPKKLRTYVKENYGISIRNLEL